MTPACAPGSTWGARAGSGGDYLGVDVNVAARVAEEAKGAEVMVSDRALEHLDRDALDVGRSDRAPSHRLYDLLAAEHSDSAHGRYNALVGRIVSFARAAEHARAS